MRTPGRKPRSPAGATALLAALAYVLPLPCLGAVAAGEPPAGLVPRFALEPNPIALAGPVRAERFVEASGRRAAFLGREDGTFEAWAYPFKILHDFQLAFSIEAYAEPVPAASLATWVEVRPECVTVRYAHAAFTVDALWVVPLDEPGGVLLLDVNTSEPLTITARFRIDLKPMWPAGLGGQYSAWEEDLNAILVTEGTRRHAAIIGSPLASEPPRQPAHNLPDAPTQFSIAVTPELAAGGLVPIAIAATLGGREMAESVYARLLRSPEIEYRESAAHYERLRSELVSIDTPNEQLDLALEWGKVAFDKGFVCSPQLGAGLIAGLGPSGKSGRPGFGWFFGGDAFINTWAMSAYGELKLVRESLAFFRGRQRGDGKMMHELSQGAAYIHWFEDYRYGYYHADTTPLYIVAVRDYVAASGDLDFARESWPSVRAAFEYCALMDEDGDGLMDNSLAGLAAVETGKLRKNDVLTDVYLAAVWADAAAATADLAAVAESEFVATARSAATAASSSLNRRFLDPEQRRVLFALLRDGTTRAEATVWSAFGLWRGVFDRASPAVEGALDELAGAGLATDWGARMVSRSSDLYEPTSYNNGAVWPFLSGFAAAALYSHWRSPAGWAYLEGAAELTFLGDRGFIPELLSGDRLRAIDGAVPHQLFATAGLVTPLLRGLLGLGVTPASGGSVLDPEATVRLAPQLPPQWKSLRVNNLRFRDVTFDLWLNQISEGGLRRAASAKNVLSWNALVVPKENKRLPLTLELPLPLGAEVVSVEGPGAVVEPATTRHGPRLVATTVTLLGGTRFGVKYHPGVRIWPKNEPLRLGDTSRRLRIIDTTLDGQSYCVKLEGRSGARYSLRLDMPFEARSISGAREVHRAGSTRFLEVVFPPGEEEWTRGELVVTLGPWETRAGISH